MRRGCQHDRRGASPTCDSTAENPVHWQQWSPRAMAEAVERDVPILPRSATPAFHWFATSWPRVVRRRRGGSRRERRVSVRQSDPLRSRHRRRLHERHRSATGQVGCPEGFWTPAGGLFCGPYYPKSLFGPCFRLWSSTLRDRREEFERLRHASEMRSMAEGQTGGMPKAGRRWSGALRQGRRQR